MVIGGWPSHGTRTNAQAVQATRDYLDEVRSVGTAKLRAPAALGVASGLPGTSICAGCT